MKISVPKRLPYVLGLFDALFVYLVFAALLTRLDIPLPFGELDPLYTAAGLAIGNAIIANRLWGRQKTRQ